MGQRQMNQQPGQAQQMLRSPARARNQNRQGGILGNLLNMQDPVGSLNKIITIFKLLG